MFLDSLPKWELGTNEGKINWLKCIGLKIRFIYDDIEGWIEIVEKKGDILYVNYKDDKIYKISTYNFRMCQLGVLLNKITSDFKIEIGDILKDDKRDIIIIDKEMRIIGKKNDNTKYYKYKCNKCKNEDWISEGNLLSQKIGCNACCFPPQKIVLGINTIWDTDRWMCDLGVSEEDAKTHTKCTHKRIEVACPDCKRKRIIIVSDINSTKSISCICGDGFPYPEKFMYSVLEQLNVHFKTEVKFDWCRYIDFNDINKIKTGRYDFVLEDTYIGNEQVIIETDGGWHGRDNKMSGIKKEESEYIDFTKDILANDNSYKVIRINCNRSDMEYMKSSIESSKLNELFDLSKIDWIKCEEFALSNRVKEACVYKKDNPKLTTSDIGKMMKIHRVTICRYLKKGHKLGWCYYVLNK